MSKEYTLQVNNRQPRPRSKRLRELGGGGGNVTVHNTITGGGGNGGGEGHTHDNKHDLDRISTDGERYVYIDGKKAKAGYADEAGHAERATIADNIADDAASKFLSSEHDDTAHGKITFEQGVDFGDFRKGQTGASIYEQDGDWYHEVDCLNVRKKFTAKEVVIEETTHVGGIQILSAANAKIVYVEEMADAYRCYFRRVDGDGCKITNKWKEGDQAFTNTFNLEQQSDGAFGNHYLWRLVTGVGSNDEYHYIDLSKTDCDGASDAPKAEDQLIQLGNRNGEAGRTAAIIVAGAGTDSPYIRQYTGITTYTLGEPETQIKPGDNVFQGRVHITGGTGLANFDDMTETIRDLLRVGRENLLKNTGFDGEYESTEVQTPGGLSTESEMYNKRLEHWTGNATSVASNRSRSQYECRFDDLSQSVMLIAGEHYVLSYRSEGEVTVLGLPGESDHSEDIYTDGTSYSRHYFVADHTDFIIAFRGSQATIWEVKLERGTIATDWCPNEFDHDPIADQFRTFRYLQSAIKEGSTDILGGLILTYMMLLGKYTDGILEKNTAGISGIYNDENDVAFWAGGNFEQAIRTVALYAKDPTYQPTPEQLNNIAKVVFTHGGRGILNDVILRGYVYAKGGVFNGTVYAQDGIFRGKLEAAEGTFSGVLKKTRTIITSENYREYIIYDEGHQINRLDLVKAGTFIVFDENFNTEGELIIDLPQMANYRATGDYQSIYDECRVLVGNTFLIYNYSTQTIQFNGRLTLPNDRTIRTIPLKKYEMLSLKAKIAPIRASAGDKVDENFSFEVPDQLPLAIKFI